MGDGLRVIVSGTREGVHRDLVRGVLSTLHAIWGPITTLVHGGASGVDRQADEWAQKMEIPVEVFPADWGRYASSAGPVRNKQMAEAGGDVCVCFPGPKSRGTWDMRNQAQRAGIPVWVIEAPKSGGGERGLGAPQVLQVPIPSIAANAMSEINGSEET